MLQVSAAQAEETVLLPPGVVLTLEGHGWGHGHGLSQYGAQGAALQGVPASTILATYYPGTTAGHLADSPMRVLVQESLPDQLQVAATSGLAVVDADTGTTYALPARPARWRLVSGGAGLAVQSGDGSRWQPWTAPNGRSAFGSRATFAGPPRLRLFLTGGGSHDYRGTLTALRGTAPAVAAGRWPEVRRTWPPTSTRGTTTPATRCIPGPASSVRLRSRRRIRRSAPCSDCACSLATATGSGAAECSPPGWRAWLPPGRRPRYRSPGTIYAAGWACAAPGGACVRALRSITPRWAAPGPSWAPRSPAR